jgi:hypothetical protein
MEAKLNGFKTMTYFALLVFTLALCSIRSSRRSRLQTPASAAFAVG